MIDFAKLQGLTIPEGNVTQITDASGRVLWSFGGKTILQVEKITADTYAGETTYTGEEFILLDIYPKTNGTVRVTYGGLTKTITDTSGVEEPNAQQVYFGTFNGVSDSVATPSSGEVTITGDFDGFAAGTYITYSKFATAVYCGCITGVVDWGSVSAIKQNAFRNCTKLVINELPDGVTRIGDYAFYGCTGITINELPASITRIGNYAFYGCTGITINELPASITSIEDHAFFNCPGITIDKVPDSVTRIGDYAFASCTGITIDRLPDSITSVGSGAFYGCTGITSFVWSSNVKEVVGFENCTSLVSIVLPEGITSIGNRAFVECRNLSLDSLPSSVTNIASYAFYYCMGLTIDSLPEGITSIGDHAFYFCKDLLLDRLPEGITSIGKNAFALCKSITISYLPSGITMIAEGTFSSANVTRMVIHEGVTKIGVDAFRSCKMTEIHIPASVTEISSTAFYCDSNTACDVYFHGTVVPTFGSSAFNIYFNKSTIHVPKGCIDAYKTVLVERSSSFKYCSYVEMD